MWYTSSKCSRKKKANKLLVTSGNCFFSVVLLRMKMPNLCKSSDVCVGICNSKLRSHDYVRANVTVWPLKAANEIFMFASVGLCWLYLDLSKLPGALHPAGYIHCVAPDVILRFPRTDHSSYHWAMINACWTTNSTQFIFYSVWFNIFVNNSNR